jgi:thiol-disulfide isomerase/thioredoxin
VAAKPFSSEHSSPYRKLDTVRALYTLGYKPNYKGRKCHEIFIYPGPLGGPWCCRVNGIGSCGLWLHCTGFRGGSQTEPKSESEKAEASVAAPSDILSSDNPVVVLPKNEDLERRKELAALIPTPAESDENSKDDASPSATQAEKPAVDDSQDTTEPEAQKEGTAADPEIQQPAGSDPAPAAQNPEAEAPAPTPERVAGGKVGNEGAELRGIVAWVNSEPLSIADLRGKVVLVDFWTYTCINCIRTMPFLKQWYSKYQDDGLVIVGVHAPEFEFEKDLDNVVNATRDYSITWLVALDNNYITWRGYSNRFWPAKYLIDKDGVVRYTHFGEGKYGETEEKIRELLVEAGADFSQDTAALPVDPTIDPAYRSNRNAEVTRELYAGYERGRSDVLYGRGGYVLQRDYYNDIDSVIKLKEPDELEPHAVYFNGDWVVGPESAKHGRMSMDYEDYLSLVYSARSVNAVLTSDSGEPYKVQVTVGGEYLTEDNKGVDVTIGDDGESYLLVKEPRLYNVLENPPTFAAKLLRWLPIRPTSGCSHSPLGFTRRPVDDSSSLTPYTFAPGSFSGGRIGRGLRRSLGTVGAGRGCRRSSA